LISAAKDTNDITEEYVEEPVPEIKQHAEESIK
jgi:hypothetical protein